MSIKIAKISYVINKNVEIMRKRMAFIMLMMFESISGLPWFHPHLLDQDEDRD